jgi:hypothetical protein
MAREVILPFRWSASEMKPATSWRSTWVVSSIQTLKARGHFERYSALLPPEHRDAILMSPAGVWLPIRVARAHYEACDQLRLPGEEIVAMGLASGERAQGGIVRTALRGATTAGVTPWAIFPYVRTFWDRGADGGDVSVVKVGPKEASVEAIGCELLQVPYFRSALRGVLLAAVRKFCTRAYVTDVTPPGLRPSCTLLFQWV